MSALYVDIGNTRIKWQQRFDDRAPVQGLLEKSNVTHFYWPDVEGKVIVSSVRDDEEHFRLLEQRYPGQVEWLTSPLVDYNGFKHCYPEASRLGVDRWLAMLGARSHKEGGVMVVDAGTALTIDVFSADNEHEGGYIVPGLTMARDALFSGTGKVRPFVDDERADNVELGRNTVNCVVAGTLRQHLALVASVCADYPEYQLLVTGGDGQTLAASLNTGYYPDLIFDGMDSLCVGLYTA